ncbi:MAG: hypothetical protein WAM66_03440 [Acidobacteriaceae bacterium]
MSCVASSCRLIVAATLLVPSLLFGQEWGRGRKYKPPPPTCTITVTVIKATNGKPVENAAVVFHPINKKGKDEGGMELKTDENGEAKLNVIPIGDTLRLQVIATGFQTFGNDYQITADKKAISIKLRHPAQQFSIYQKHPDQEVGGPKVEEKRAQPATHQPPGTTE